MIYNRFFNLVLILGSTWFRTNLECEGLSLVLTETLPSLFLPTVVLIKLDCDWSFLKCRMTETAPLSAPGSSMTVLFSSFLSFIVMLFKFLLSLNDFFDFTGDSCITWTLSFEAFGFNCKGWTGVDRHEFLAVPPWMVPCVILLSLDKLIDWAPERSLDLCCSRSDLL